MKYLIVLALALLASATAFTLPSEEIYSRDRFMPVVGHKGRIAGGENADIRDFGFQVGLSLQAKPSSGSYWCGGSLIASNWVLTAAHCTEGMNYINVYLGGAKRMQGEKQLIVRDLACDSQNPNPFDCNVIEHPDWNTNTLLNDIALIKIENVQETENIWLVKLPARSSQYATYVRENAIASGWGRMGDATTSVAPELQRATMEVISNAECASVYGSTVTLGNICLNTKYAEEHRSTCKGDSGGPLVLAAENPRERVQIGLTSFGARAGCEKGYPVAFSRVTYYLDWIHSFIQA